VSFHDARYGSAVLVMVRVTRAEPVRRRVDGLRLVPGDRSVFHGLLHFDVDRGHDRVEMRAHFLGLVVGQLALGDVVFHARACTGDARVDVLLELGGGHRKALLGVPVIVREGVPLPGG